MGAPATFGAFTPGVAREYTASTTANVISTAGDATLTVADAGTTPGHLVNGAFFLPQPLQGLGVVKTYTGPVSNDQPTITFKQQVNARRRVAHGHVQQDADVHPVDDDAVALLIRSAEVRGIGPGPR